MKKLILLLPLILISLTAKADQLSAIVGGTSSLYNDQIVGFKYNNLSISKITNDYNYESYIVAYSYDLLDNDIKFLGLDHNVSISAGVITNYYIKNFYLKDGISLYVSPKLESKYSLNDRFSLSIDTSVIGLKTFIVSASINYTF